MFPCYSLCSSHLLLPPNPMSTCLSSVSVYPLLPAGRFISTIFLCSVLLLFSLSVMYNSLWQHGLQHARLPCLSSSPSSVQFSSFAQLCPTLCHPMGCSTPGLPVHHQLSVCSNSSPLSWWCYPTISSSVDPFSSCLQSFSASGSFPVSQFFASGGQSIGVSASASVLPIQDWFPLGFPLGLSGLISLQSRGLSRVFSNTRWKASVLRHSTLFLVQLSYPYICTGKTTALNLCRQPDVSAFNTLSVFVLAFLSRSKNLLISWLWLPVPSDFGVQEKRICHCFHFSPSVDHEIMGPDVLVLVFWKLSFKPAFLLSSLTLIKRL